MRNKKNILLFFVVASIALNTNAQDKLTKLKGFVKYDSLYLQDINILNKTSNFGASSNAIGAFILYAKKEDSILFSSVVYENRVIKISETHINSKSITVYLEPDLYQLEEIMLHKKILLNSIKIAVTKGTILDNDVITNNKPPNARKLTDPNANAGGINPIAIYMMLTKKARLKRKAKRVKQQQIEEQKLTFTSTVKDLYGAPFFKETLHISEDKIYLFLDYCEGNGLNNYYNSNEIVVKNFLIKQAQIFNTINN